MKIMSDSVVTKQDLEDVKNDIDQKQTRQIKELRWAVGASILLDFVILGLVLVNLP